MACNREKLDLESSLPPSNRMMLAALPILPSDANLTFPPKILMGPPNELLACVISKIPLPFTLAVKLNPGAPMLEIGPPKMIVAELPSVRVRLTAPKKILSLNVSPAVPLAKFPISPHWILPPMVIPPLYFPEKSRVVEEAIIPPLSESLLPPMVFTPPAINVPSLKVKPPE